MLVYQRVYMAEISIYYISGMHIQVHGCEQEVASGVTQMCAVTQEAHILDI